MKQLIAYTENGKWGYRDEETNEILIPVEYDEIQSCNSWDYDYFIVKIDTKYGVINEKGETIAPVVFDEIVENFKGHYLEVTFHGKKGVVTLLGNMLVPFDYDDVYVFGDNTFGVKKEGKWQIVDRKNKLKSPYFYDDIGDFYDSLFIALMQDGKWKFLYQNGEEVFPLYVDEFAWECPLLQIKINDKWGVLKVLNSQTEEVLPVEYDSIETECLELHQCGTSGAIGVVDQVGKVIVPPVYDYVDKGGYEFTQKIIAKKEGADDSAYGLNRYIDVEKNHKWGFFDISGNEKVPAMYDELGQVYDFEDIIPVRLNEKWGYINRENEIISPFIYDEADTFWHYNFAIVTIDDKQGLIDKKGNIIYPLVCDSIWILDNNLVRIALNEELFHIDQTGKLIERYDKNALVSVATI